jgi:hypothetical protein
MKKEGAEKTLNRKRGWFEELLADLYFTAVFVAEKLFCKWFQYLPTTVCCCNFTQDIFNTHIDSDPFEQLFIIDPYRAQPSFFHIFQPFHNISGMFCLDELTLGTVL